VVSLTQRFFFKFKSTCSGLDIDHNQIKNTFIKRLVKDAIYKIQFPFNNQPDALIIQIYSVIKLHVSGIFFAHHQDFSTVHSALVSFMQVLMTASKQSQNGNPFRPEDGRWQKRCPKHVEFYERINLDN
jgi:hypothetical protein